MSKDSVLPWLRNVVSRYNVALIFLFFKLSLNETCEDEAIAMHNMVIEMIAAIVQRRMDNCRRFDSIRGNEILHSEVV